jgi:hypothetical protein
MSLSWRVSWSVMAAVIAATLVAAQAHDESKYPDWRGLWYRNNSVAWDPTKPLGRGQQPPLTEEYQRIFEASLARQESGTDDNAVVSCLPPGMPRAMIVYEPMDVVVLPDVTYLLLSYFSEVRRIFTDGRAWPDVIDPSYIGTSIGKWQDTDGDGRYDTLLVETRGFKGPRTFDSRSIPLHADNQTVIHEKLALDKNDPNILANEITTIDHALTRPWTVNRSYRRIGSVGWMEYVCAEDNHQVVLEGENYMVGGDGRLMPTRKDQARPDLRHFGPATR